MSVINQMLKDLDQRQGNENSQPSEPASFQQATNLGAQTKSNNLLVVILLTAILVVLAVIGWQLLVNTSASQITPIAVKDTPAVHVAVEAETQQSVTESERTIVSSSNLNSAQKTALATPPAVEPEQPISVIQTQVEKAESSVSLPSTIEKSQPAVETTDVEPEATKEAIEVTEQNLNTAPEKTTQPKATFVIEKSSVQLPPEQRIAKWMEEAQTAFDKGYISEAIEKFENILKVQDSHVDARNMLAVAWYGRGETQQAISTLNHGLQRYSNIEKWRLTAAKIFFKQNNLQGAFSYLNVNLASPSKDFLTMKGTLARQLSRFPEAEAVYQQLTKREPTVGNWWLGLAIAQDSQGKAELALGSYQQVVALGGVSNQTISFANQRITELKG